MHFVTGSALAVSRMVLTYVDFATSFSRLDLPVVEGVRQVCACAQEHHAVCVRARMYDCDADAKAETQNAKRETRNAKQHWDAGHASFMAMLYLDFFYNAPITSTLAYNLAAAMYHRHDDIKVPFALPTCDLRHLICRSASRDHACMHPCMHAPMHACTHACMHPQTRTSAAN